MSFGRELLKRLSSSPNGAKEISAVDDAIGLVSDGVIIVDTDGKITFLNTAASRMTGRWDLAALGLPIDDVVDLMDRSQRFYLSSSLARINDENIEISPDGLHELGEFDVIDLAGGTHRVRAKLGKIGENQGEMCAMCIVLHDINELYQAEMALQRMARFESLGILAGGITHDFSSLLTALMTSIDLALEAADDPDVLEKRLNVARDATQRGKLVAKQLLNLAKGGDPHRTLVSPGRLLRGISNITSCGANVSFNLELGDPLRLLHGDEAQLNQVMLNLLINAAQSMPNGGEVTISAENIKRKDVPAKTIEAQPWWLKIAVHDCGPGIAESDLPKIFEPFFSTKESGTGLGLAMAFSIVQKHEGTIGVKPRLGGGTIFEVYLPAEETFEKAEAEETPRSDVSGRGRILVMDDEAIVRDMIRDALILLGYSVTCCCDGVQAVRMYRSAQQSDCRYDVVMLDLTVIGGRGGKTAIKELLEADPDVVAIACSGHPNDPVFSRWHDFGFRSALEKPFDIHQLGAKIHEVLGQDS